MNEELRLHIKKLQNRAMCSLIAIISAITSIVFGVVFLFVPSLVAIIFFVVFVVSILYLVHSNRLAKKEAKEAALKPVVFKEDKNFSFEEMVAIFEKLTDKENHLSTSEDVRFFRLNKIFKLRVVLYRTADFNKKEFDNAKKRINQKANKVFNISHWVTRTDAGKMMRFNIIYAQKLTNELYQFISQNANRNLTRVEGIIKYRHC